MEWKGSNMDKLCFFERYGRSELFFESTTYLFPIKLIHFSGMKWLCPRITARYGSERKNKKFILKSCLQRIQQCSAARSIIFGHVVERVPVILELTCACVHNTVFFLFFFLSLLIPVICPRRCATPLESWRNDFFEPLIVNLISF